MGGTGSGFDRRPVRALVGKAAASGPPPRPCQASLPLYFSSSAQASGPNFFCQSV